MKQIANVFRMQFILFKQEKGMLLFYLLCIGTIGILVPIFSHSMTSNLILAAFLTIAFQKPIAADALAGERERKTLETLLSSPIDGKHIILGKISFCLCFAVSFFTLSTGLLAVTRLAIQGSLEIAVWQWLLIIGSAVMIFTLIALAGCYISVKSSDLRMAHSRLSQVAYPLGLFLIIYITVVFLDNPLWALITGTIFVLVCVCIGVVYGRFVYDLNQSVFFENIRQKKNKTGHCRREFMLAPKRQFSIVFGHELRYLLTLRRLLLSFALLCFAPVCIICIGKYYFGEINIYYGVLLTALMMPRTPTNLIAYSIGGEKVYKTGESLLSTPLHMLPVFLAKSMIPILVSAIMLLLSSGITLAGANAVGSIFEGGAVYRYTADQLILLFPAGILSCVTMVFLTGLLSVELKTPRQGLYISSVLGIVFVLPPLAMVFLTGERLFWSVIYCFILFLINVIGVIGISKQCERPKIMGRL